MKTYCIACGVFRTDLQEILPALPEQPEVEYLEGGLHSEPNLLRRELQNAIDLVPQDFDRIVLLYGVCGKGIVGLKSLKHTLVIPRVHDCISLFLGGTREYRKQFSHQPGTYYISPGWYEEQVQPRGRQMIKKQAHLPPEYADTLDKEVLKTRFGDDNSKAVTEFFDAWKKNYTRAVYIDTGDGEENKYSAYARSMAEENGWQYTRLEGSRRLIAECFSAAENSALSGEEILVVPPGREVTFDSATGLVSFASSLQETGGRRTLVFEEDQADKEAGRRSSRRAATLGLGIDAGGTYTDAVLFDFKENRILSKAKSLTTKWKYSEGIMAAVSQLPADSLGRVDLVSLSTTLVTNAIVESNIYPVGLLMMPMASMTPENISHTPMAVIKGRMTIEGTASESIDPDEIRRVAREMVTNRGVRAFAVSGYGASVNPELELKVKEVLRDETGLDVCCGHELSGTLNFYVRAHTAVLNAGVIPIMEEFLSEMKEALQEAGIDAPQLVVKGDGSVMTGPYASEFPVQTALSGPAASMAGASFLTGYDDALVIDVGGTTSDIGYLDKGEVYVCEDGASIGSWRTHVKAVDMLTTGLGGDSAIVFNRQQWSIGPGRITPFSWLASEYTLEPGLMDKTLMDFSDGSSTGLQWLFSTGKEPEFTLTKQEAQIMEELREGPLTVGELSRRLCHGVWKLLKTDRLEKAYCVQRSGLTPTDLFHLQGKLDLYSTEGLQDYFNLHLELQGESSYAVMDHLMKKISTRLAHSVLERIFPGDSETKELFAPILERGNDRLSLTPTLKTPVIGLGAPASLFLGDAVRMLGGEVHIPENGDVANALGAVTSRVAVETTASITATPEGSYRVLGMGDTVGEISLEDRETLEEAEQACLKAIVARTREKAVSAGSSETRVTVYTEDKTAESSGGDILFLERQYRALLKGAPDLV